MNENILATRFNLKPIMKYILLLSLYFSGNVLSAIKICELNPSIILESEQLKSDWERDSTKYISFQNLYLNLRKDPRKYFIVDVRSDAAYQSYHIENSFHFQGQSVLVKSQLYNQSVVLIGDGHSYRQLESLHDAMILSTAGFMLFVSPYLVSHTDFFY